MGRGNALFLLEWTLILSMDLLSLYTVLLSKLLSMNLQNVLPTVMVHNCTSDQKTNFTVNEIEKGILGRTGGKGYANIKSIYTSREAGKARGYLVIVKY